MIFNAGGLMNNNVELGLDTCEYLAQDYQSTISKFANPDYLPKLVKCQNAIC
jgi:hypothetical protein